MKAATYANYEQLVGGVISIHAAREGGDGTATKPFEWFAISIHAAREGGDCFGTIFECSLCISIHAAREGGDRKLDCSCRHNRISIHAAREGGDLRQECRKLRRILFQSTPPVKAATEYSYILFPKAHISIHAAREGGDGYNLRYALQHCYFNPRRP